MLSSSTRGPQVPGGSRNLRMVISIFDSMACTLFFRSELQECYCRTCMAQQRSGVGEHGMITQIADCASNMQIVLHILSTKQGAAGVLNRCCADKSAAWHRCKRLQSVLLQSCRLQVQPPSSQ